MALQRQDIHPIPLKDIVTPGANAFAVMFALESMARASLATVIPLQAYVLFGVARDVQLAPSPKVDGYVVGMKASLVDVVGNAVPHTDVMLHHVVFAKLGVFFLKPFEPDALFTYLRSTM